MNTTWAKPDKLLPPSEFCPDMPRVMKLTRLGAGVSSTFSAGGEKCTKGGFQCGVQAVSQAHPTS